MSIHLAQFQGDPYVSVAGFKAHPTYLDLQNIRPGSSVLAAQDQALYNILLEASAEADKICKQPLQAHLKIDTPELTPDRRGRLSFHPKHNPVRRLTSLSYGTLVGAKTDVTVTNPDFRYTENQILRVQLGMSSASWSGGLQLGSPSPSSRLYTAFAYVAGFGNTKLTAGALVGATSITVDNPLGIEPGDTLRSWEPGVEEQVVVGPGYVPVTTVTPTPIPLVSGLLNAHATGSHITALGPDAYLATVYLAMDILSRPGEGGSSKGGPGSRVSMQTSKNAGSQMLLQSVWHRRAVGLLNFYESKV